jgi:hypothetical protein
MCAQAGDGMVEQGNPIKDDWNGAGKMEVNIDNHSFAH